MAVLGKIECEFSIFDNGRDYSGTKRGYILDNVSQAVSSDFTRERLKLREMVGYVGHGLRELAGKLNVGEVDTAKLDNGQQVVIKAIPACVATDLEVDSNGNVRHIEEVIDNEEGRTLMGLHESRVGGFSWASEGYSQGNNTFINRIYGFDYVCNPNFIRNRGYVHA